MYYIFLRNFDRLLILPGNVDLDKVADHICSFSYTGPGSNVINSLRSHIDQLDIDYILTDGLPIIQNLDIHCIYEEVSSDPEYDF